MIIRVPDDLCFCSRIDGILILRTIHFGKDSKCPLSTWSPRTRKTHYVCDIQNLVASDCCDRLYGHHTTCFGEQNSFVIALNVFLCFRFFVPATYNEETMGTFNTFFSKPWKTKSRTVHQNQFNDDRMDYHNNCTRVHFEYRTYPECVFLSSWELFTLLMATWNPYRKIYVKDTRNANEQKANRREHGFSFYSGKLE